MPVPLFKIGYFGGPGSPSGLQNHEGDLKCLTTGPKLLWGYTADHTDCFLHWLELSVWKPRELLSTCSGIPQGRWSLVRASARGHHAISAFMWNPMSIPHQLGTTILNIDGGLYTSIYMHACIYISVFIYIYTYVCRNERWLLSVKARVLWLGVPSCRRRRS